MSQKKGTKAPPSSPKPSSSVILISPTNEVLLLHRVQTSRSFPSAHVFPGGNVDTFHDGTIPTDEDPSRHTDSETYRLAAVRETFEESGILLAYNNGFGRLLEVEDTEREAGRKAVHKKEVPFTKWLSKKGGRPDTGMRDRKAECKSIKLTWAVDNLIPFTRWITPPNVPKRFTTQMYLYFLPVSTANAPKIGGPLLSAREALIPNPTHDGGLEHTEAKFLPAETWLEQARSGKIILFPPQFFLLTIVSQFLTPKVPNVLTPETLEQQRKQLKQFVKRGGFPPWGEACISPQALIGQLGNGKVVLSLEHPGLDLEKHGRIGVKDFVVLVKFSKEGPRDLEIKTRKEIMQDVREDVKKTGTAYSHHLQHLQTKREKL
ncbi:hypothetical protein E2P81_ATG06671 [Venturia nashicola]|uniref:Nudix hydrolase domain-containing protein n=1 Tax=Venturia nashicola TaxID=86259 RepID=A0A4Z1P573_9PEZI|nr:hypothetical protein E6O75_ATG06841 [Venturia nashicola]TLD30018.1 hypothetical protein E2P81_ATG06671 [Venturia nashicola]